MLPHLHKRFTILLQSLSSESQHPDNHHNRRKRCGCPRQWQQLHQPSQPCQSQLQLDATILHQHKQSLHSSHHHLRRLDTNQHHLRHGLRAQKQAASRHHHPRRDHGRRKRRSLHMVYRHPARRVRTQRELRRNFVRSRLVSALGMDGLCYAADAAYRDDFDYCGLHDHFDYAVDCVSLRGACIDLSCVR